VLPDDCVAAMLPARMLSPAEAAALLKPKLIETIKELSQLSPEQRINNRIEKFNGMGFWDELPEQPDTIHHGDAEPEPEINEIIPANHA